MTAPLAVHAFAPCLLSLALAAAPASPPASALPSVRAPTDEPEERAPSADAKPHTVYRSESAGGLRYTWVLPEGYDGETPRHLSVILHGTGLDYRWGHWNNKPGIFRPWDVVVSVDGTSPGQGDTRLFLDKKDDVEAFAEFLGEMRAAFEVDRIFLYGHSQGGFFVVHFAGAHPELVGGVCAHASGAWRSSRSGGAVREVPIAFLHGTADPVVPYRQSPGSRDAYAEAKHELLHLRRLQRYNHWPNAVRATEVLDWCQGMSATEPREALDAAIEILRVKPADEYRWETVVGFSAARDVLRRLEGAGPRPFEKVEPDVASAAREWIEAIEEHAAKHVKALRKHVSKKADLVLSDDPWVGHLVALREDFRGVDAVEEYVAALDYDDVAADHAKRADKILECWYREKDAKRLYETILPLLSEAFLFEGFPPELGDRLAEIHADARELKLSKRATKAWPDVEAWRESWTDGFEEYADLWKDWKGPGKRDGRAAR